jgi:hypothetical protein
MRIVLACLIAATLTACVTAQPASRSEMAVNDETSADLYVGGGSLLIDCRERVYFLLFLD